MVTMNQKKYQFPERIASRVLWFNQNSKDLTLKVEELLEKWEWLKNRDFEEIDFVESPPHSLLDI